MPYTEGTLYLNWIFLFISQLLCSATYESIAVHLFHTGLHTMSASTSNPITAGFELFLPPNLGNANSSWAASVINICDNYGTYAMQCTAGSAPSATCGPNAVVRIR